MTYNVFSGMLNRTQSINQSTTLCHIICDEKHLHCTVKLRYNGLLGTSLKGVLYLKSVISKLGHGWLIILGIFTVQLQWPPESFNNCLPSSRQ